MTQFSRLGLDVSLDQLEEDVNAFVVMYDGKTGLPSPEVWEEVEGRWREVMEDAERAAEEGRRKAEESEEVEREEEEIEGREEDEGTVTKLKEEL